MEEKISRHFLVSWTTKKCLCGNWIIIASQSHGSESFKAPGIYQNTEKYIHSMALNFSAFSPSTPHFLIIPQHKLYSSCRRIFAKPEGAESGVTEQELPSSFSGVLLIHLQP